MTTKEGNGAVGGQTEGCNDLLTMTTTREESWKVRSKRPSRFRRRTMRNLRRAKERGSKHRTRKERGSKVRVRRNCSIAPSFWLYCLKRGFPNSASTSSKGLRWTNLERTNVEGAKQEGH